MIVIQSSMKTTLPFTWRRQSFTLINQSLINYLGMNILDLSKSLMYDFITTILRPSMVIRQNYSDTDTDSLAYKIRAHDFYKDINPYIEKRFDTSNYPTNHLELKQDLMVKCLKCLKMKLVGSWLLNLLVWELNYTLTKCLMALKIKNVRGWQRMLQKGVFNFDDYRECLFSRKNHHRKMNVIRCHCH